MTKSSGILLSVVVPVYNESAGLNGFHESLIKVLRETVDSNYEIIYVDDGSADPTTSLVRKWHAQDDRVKLIKFSRNFGKEYALSAGIAAAHGEAIIMLDGDGQHPVEMIPEFFKAWQDGAQVVVGLYTDNHYRSLFKKASSGLFYKFFNHLTDQAIVSGSTDFRLIDRRVQKAFTSLKENNRFTRGLIDWLGFKRQFIHFSIKPRVEGKSSYKKRQLARLAANSFVSLSPTPLYWFGSLGVLITIGAFLLGLAVIIEQLLLGDPLRWKFTGTAMLGILILFLVGLLLLSQGILSLYISHIHSQSKERPLYVIDYECSAGIDNKEA